MAQEFTINSSAIESKINQLLPSQGGFGAGVDFSASTMVIPIVDLTETAEGSNVRQDLQVASSFNRNTSFSITNATSTIVNTTGYWLVHYTSTLYSISTGDSDCNLSITDGISSKIIKEHRIEQKSTDLLSTINGSITIFLGAGHSLTGASNSANGFITGSVLQIADIDGNLTNP